MKTIEIIVEGQKTITGTNCANCKFTLHAKEGKVESGELNKQGGIDPTDKRDLKTAQKADLVTLPGTGHPTTKMLCTHPEVKLWVTERNCCAYWDAPGVLRAFKKVVGN